MISIVNAANGLARLVCRRTPREAQLVIPDE